MTSRESMRLSTQRCTYMFYFLAGKRVWVYNPFGPFIG